LAAEDEPVNSGAKEAGSAKAVKRVRLGIEIALAAGTLITAVAALIGALNGHGPT
jgi:hypothetical protein